jgi:diguanylate cyclase (GGDEF)-like protein
VWLGYLIAGGAAVIAYAVVPGGDIPAAVIYQLVGLSSAVALVVGVHLHQPAHRAPWYMMAAGLLLWSIADGVGSVWAIAVDPEAFPTPADAVYLVGYLAVMIGIALLIRAGRHGSDPAGTLDSLILTTSLAVLSWVLLARPTIETYQESALAAAVAVSYPIADIVLAGLLIRLLTTSGGRTRSYRLLVLALVLLILADSASSALQLLTYDATDPLDYLWLASYVAWGAAALHPSMVAFTAAATPAPTKFTRTRLAALTVAVLVAPLTLAVETALGLPPTIWAAVICSIILFLLVVARMNLSLEQIQAANAEREAAQDQLAHQAAHDPLTGLANRAQVMRLISGALSRGQRSGALIGLLFIDLDGFKQVNDTLGHPAGDEVLLAVAERMQRAVRAGDVVARLGGDEFLVLLEPLDEQPSAVAVGERVIAAVAEPIELRSGHHARIGASVGLAISQDAGTDADRLLQEADLAVYRAKSAGRGRIEVFDRSLRERLLLRTEIEESIRTALDADSAELRLVPVVELITGELGGLEAQVRCRVGRVLVDRADLIADLGRSAAIIELDRWTLRRATASLVALGEDHSAVSVTVPMTLHHLLLDQVRQDIRDALAAADLAPERLMVMLSAAELTDDLRLLTNLDLLRSWGVRICLDGFGAGSAPTNQLLRLPVAAVRLDDVLLQPAAPQGAGEQPEQVTGPTTTQMLRLTVQTAHAFGYQVIAPGLDDGPAVSLATRAGCEFGQGLAATDLLPDDSAMTMAVSWRPAP